jgi:transposase-like protein
MDVNLVTLMDTYGTDDECRALLEGLRWPRGVECPRCQGTTISRIHKRGQFDCDSCRYQFSVTVGTVLHDSKLPLRKWLLAAYLMVEAKKGVSANQMKRTLGVSYKTAWYLCHRIRSAMALANPEPLTGEIEADETWIGGVQKGIPRGKWRDGKTMVLGAIERGGEVRLKVDKRATKKAIHAFLNEVTAEVDVLYTDEHSAYVGFAERHEYTTHRNNEWVRGEVHTNSVEGVWSLFKRSVVGSYHQLSAKHLEAYLDEFEWRFNNRDNDFLFRDTVIQLMASATLPYSELIAEPE